MINANMMYLRPGNLFKEFVIENNRQKVTSTGRVVNDHKGDGIKTLYGCLADATTETAKISLPRTIPLHIRLCREEHL